MGIIRYIRRTYKRAMERIINFFCEIRYKNQSRITVKKKKKNTAQKHNLIRIVSEPNEECIRFLMMCTFLCESSTGTPRG